MESSPIFPDQREGLLAAACDEFEGLLHAFANLAAPRPLEEQLDSLLVETRRLLRAEAGSLYVVHNDRLRFICCQNDARPNTSEVSAPLADRPWAEAMYIKTLPIDQSSLAGYVASTGHTIQIADVYELDNNVPYHFDRTNDEKSGYRTRSMLAIQLCDPGGRVLGVLQLINRLDDEGGIIPFSDRDRRILTSVGAVTAVSIRNAQLNEQLHRSHLDTILHLATAAEFRDADTGNHIRRVSYYCEAIARRMGCDREWTRQVLVASPMHDVGKLGIPDAILQKPESLTLDERHVMQQHTTMGARILEGGENELLVRARRISHYHHERWDGSGYPEGLAGEDIPLEARVAAVADVFDALSSSRVYKTAVPFDRSFEMIQAGRGKQFDPTVVDAFLAISDEIRAIFDAYQPE